MEHDEYDLLVIGGGITGAGISLDAQTRGIKTALVEMQDFAAGTSSRSTKLVHGGLRYLKQFEIKLVSEVGKERAIVYENGPHVTTPEWMLLPIYKGGTFGKFSTSIGLRFYDYLAKVARKERRTMLSSRDTIAKEPLLKRERLKGSGYYVEYRTDDARLTIEVMKEAVKRGVDAVNYAKVEELLYKNDKVVGAKVKDTLTGRTFRIFAKKTINATGPWVDEIREKDQSKTGKSLQLTKGVHLVIDQSRFPLKQAIYFDTADGRMVFAIPRDGKTYIGTTDTNYKGDKKNPKATREDWEYLIKCVNDMFPSINLTKNDIESSWAGLRPLIHEDGKSPSEISRKDEVWISKSGLISIAGGKLTGYRKMAEEAVNLISNQLKQEGTLAIAECKTINIPISGGDVGGSENFHAFIREKVKEGLKYQIPKKSLEKLVKMYGTNIAKIFSIMNDTRYKVNKSEIPMELYAQVLYSIHEEMTVTPADFFIRRTGALYFDIEFVKKWSDTVCDLMARELNWSPKQIQLHKQEVDNQLNMVTTPVELEA